MSDMLMEMFRRASEISPQRQTEVETKRKRYYSYSLFVFSLHISSYHFIS